MNLSRQFARFASGLILAIIAAMAGTAGSAYCQARPTSGAAKIATAPHLGWVPSGNLNVARTDYTATLLANGKVLVAGGGRAAPLASAELFDPDTGTSTATGSMLMPRAGALATLLSDGRVLMVGGWTDNSPPMYHSTLTAELYDPATGTWSATGSFRALPMGTTATLLRDGRVLVTGGFAGGNLPGQPITSNAELYDPATGTWTPTGAPNVPRIGHTATLLMDGKVLIAGGSDEWDPPLTTMYADAEVYDPAVGRWSRVGSLAQPRAGHTATLLPDGRVLVVGGIAYAYSSGAFASAEVFDPGSGTWKAAPGLVAARTDHTATLLADGDVLVVGGSSVPGVLSSCEVRDANTGAWQYCGNLGTPRTGHAAMLLPDGRVLVVGGEDGAGAATGVTSTELYEATTAPPVAIDAGFTGTWYDPAQSGQGIFIEVLPDQKLLAGWFAYDPAGEQQAWIFGMGTYGGNIATVTDVLQPKRGRWIPNFNPREVTYNYWGTLTFTFTDRNHGRVDFDSVRGYGTGSMNLTRLTQPAGLMAVGTFIGSPGAVAPDASGNVYVSSQNIVFRVRADGSLARVAGNGVAGYSGDGGPAVNALLDIPFAYPELLHDPLDFSPLVGGLAVDASGNLYIADAYNNRVRKVDTSGNIATVAGGGGDGGIFTGSPALGASIKWPQGVALDPAGNLYVTSQYGPLYKVSTDGVLTVLAEGNCGETFREQGLCVPEQIAIDDAANVYVPDSYCRVRRVAPDGSTVTVAGNEQPDYDMGYAFTCGYAGDGGQAKGAALGNMPYGVAIDHSGNLYIADTGNSCIRKVDASGTIATFAGTCGDAGYAGDGKAAVAALLNFPDGVAVDGKGNVFIADTVNGRVRKVAADGIITTYAGNGPAMESPPGAIGPWHTGAWFDPAQSGHGLFIEVLPNQRLLAGWFAYNPEGTEQAWFFGSGAYVGDTAIITAVEQPTGGRWIPNFDPAQVVRNPWGTLRFTFTDCDHGRVDFNSIRGYGSGSMNLTRLTQPAGLACP